MGSDSALITWCKKRLGRSGVGERCERLPHGRCCSARGGRSARHKLWAKKLGLRRSDLCREEQSWVVPQKIPSPRSVAWSVCAPAHRGERFVAVATDKSYARVKSMNVRNNLASSPAQACRYLSLLSQVPDGMRHLLKPYSNPPKCLKKQCSTENVDYSRKYSVR